MTESGADHARAVRELARAAGRTLMGDGVEWRVYELPPGVYDRRGSASLVFESSDAFRRVRAFPSEWRSLSDNDLYRVSFKA